MAMAIEEAREDIPDFDRFREEVCHQCTANDWYCSSDCDLLEEASKLEYDIILKAYARNDGDLYKVCRYLKYRRK